MVVSAVQSDLDALVAEYVARNPRSRELLARAERSLPGGNTRTGAWMDPFPPYIDRGEGVYLYDVDGHQILDFNFNNSSMILGHAHPAIVAAVTEHVARGTGYNRPTVLEIELAEALKERVPSLEHVRFTNSGTEAVLNAVRAAIGFTGKRKIAKMEGAYHGTTDHALVSLNPPVGPELGPAERPRPYLSSAGLSGAADEVVILPFNDAEACAAIIGEHAGELAAVIVDPLMTNNGVIQPDEGYLQHLREITESFGIVLVFDEIVSFRASLGGAQVHYGVKPDLSTFGKVAVGGTPGGVFGGRAEIMALYDPRVGAKIQQAGTFNGNPISMAAGLVTLKLLTPEVQARFEAMSNRVAAELAAIFREAGVVASTAAIGSMFRLYLAPEPPRTYRETANEDKLMQRKLNLWLLNHDIQWQQGGYISYVTEDAHLDRLLSAVRAALREL
jgi:glutamate-1-semialdehyde 2,1-aminomutase